MREGTIIAVAGAVAIASAVLATEPIWRKNAEKTLSEELLGWGLERWAQLSMLAGGGGGRVGNVKSASMGGAEIKEEEEGKVPSAVMEEGMDVDVSSAKNTTATNTETTTTAPVDGSETSSSTESVSTTVEVEKTDDETRSSLKEDSSSLHTSVSDDEVFKHDLTTTTLVEVEAAARDAIRFLEVELSEALTELRAARVELDRVHNEAEHALEDVAHMMEQDRADANARVQALQTELASARAQVEGLQLDIHRMQREFEKELIAKMQDYDEVQTAAFENRIRLEREALEARKARDLSVEMEYLRKQSEKMVQQKERALEGQQAQNHAQRMAILRGFYEDVSKHEERIQQVKAAHDASVAAFRRGLQAAGLRDSLRVDTPTGICDATIMKQIQQAAGDDELVRAVVERIPAPVLEKGVATDPALLSEYDVAVEKGLERALVREDQGQLIFLVGKILSKVIRPSRGPIEGDEADAIFSRARLAIQRNDLEAAFVELDRLHPEVREPCNKWIQMARERIYVNNALTVMQARALDLLH